MITIKSSHSAERDDSPNVMVLGLTMAVLGSIAYLLLVWVAVHFGMI